MRNAHSICMPDAANPDEELRKLFLSTCLYLVYGEYDAQQRPPFNLGP